MDEFFREILNFTEDGVLAFDADLVIRYANPAAERIFSDGRGSLIGQALDRLVPAAYRERHRDQVATFAAAGPAHRRMRSRSTIYAKRISGEAFPAEITIAALPDTAPCPLVAVVRDLSTESRSDLALHSVVTRTSFTAGLDFFQALVRELATTLGVTGVIAARYRPEIDGFESLAHWHEGTMQPRARFPAVDSPFQLTAQGYSYLPSGVARRYEHHPFLAGLRIDSYLGAPLVDRDGRFIGIVAILNRTPIEPEDGARRIITLFARRAGAELARLIDEEASRRSDQGRRSLLDHAPFGAFQLGPDGTTRFANPALAAILGCTDPEALLGTGLAERLTRAGVPPGDFADRLAGGPFDLALERDDGRQVTLRISGRIVDAPFREAAWLDGFAEDVSDLKALEHRLRQSQKLEAIGQLTSGIAHDFNNLLTVIQCHVALADELVPAQRRDLHDDLRAIGAAAARGAEMVRKVLRLSRTGRLEMRPLVPAAVAADLEVMFRRLLPASIRFDLAVEPDLPAIEADPCAHDQMQLNQITKAPDATPPGGSIRLELARGEPVPRAPAAPGSVRIRVIDTGTGIDASIQSRVFEPFFTTKGPESGTGLGLAMVSELMRHHQGQVSVAAGPDGRGTTVELAFHARPPVAEGERRTVPQSPQGGSEHLLLVEDEPSLRAAASRVLGEHGYRIDEAADATEALRLIDAEGKRFDLVVSDVMMPGVGGGELARRLRDRQPPVPVLLTTGFPQQLAIEAGAVPAEVPVLAKPYGSADLLIAVRTALRAAQATAGKEGPVG
ncbi:MAG: response regulator [Gemmatimonadales bacterium]